NETIGEGRNGQAARDEGQEELQLAHAGRTPMRALTMRSATPTSITNMAASAAAINRAAQIWVVWPLYEPVSSRTPSPPPAALDSSLTTAPTSEMAMPTFIEANRIGIAAGQRSFQKVCQGEAS